MKIHVKHILLKQKFEAEDILRLLQGGAVFEDLAKKYSQCSSAANGGDLGLVNSQRLDEDFAEAAFLLKAGTVSTNAVRTKFGYHVIYRIK